MNRRAFTLVEMLVATGVFLIGFSGIFGLFLAGVKFRKQSDELTRCSLAISSLVEEFRIDAGRENLGGPQEPNAYVGDGYAANGAEINDGQLFPYALQPGIWYRVLTCTDLRGDDTNALTTGLKMRLFVIALPTADETLTLVDLARRLRLDGGIVNLSDPLAIGAHLVDRQIALQADLVIVRHPPLP